MIQILFAQAMLFLLLENVTHGAEWKPKEMNPGELKPTVEKFITADCDGTPCDDYKIAYFTSGPLKPGQKTILYIIGGPGPIVNRKRELRDLNGLESKFRIVYFDIRGAGLSAPQSAANNVNDKFLRAKYVVKDIEEIRKQVLADDPWDAIYAHSAGSVFAQIYAEQFGRITPSNPKVRVKTLILSAPISRHIDNEPFRAAMIATNLKNILENNTTDLDNTPNLECPWKQPASSVIGGVLNRLMRAVEGAADDLRKWFFGARADEASLEKFLKSTNNFCFLDPTRIDNIRATLERKLNLINLKYGSISFVSENHKEMAKNDNDSQFKMEFPYPEKFFVALRMLGRLGSPRQKDTDTDTDVKARRFQVKARSFQVNAALVVGYYLDSPTPQDESSEECNPNAQFFSTLFPDIVDFYCRRFKNAAENDSSANFRSARAANVLGIHEGIHRWPVRLMGQLPAQCDKGSQFLEFAGSRPASDKRTARELVDRVGFQKGDRICPWDPAKHQHSVRALILKGSQDAAIHGCQAEHFFKEGLLHADKEFIEFLDLGHDWIGEINTERKGDLATLLEIFLNGPAQFRGSRETEVKEAMKRLGAINRNVANIASSGC